MSVQTESPVGRTLWRWQVSTAAALLVGYSGYYLCRSNLAVAAPLLLADATVAGIDRKAIGVISSAGVLSYAAGKLITGIVGDFAGGRVMFLIGLFGSVLATLAFGFGSSVFWFALVWAFNRFFQSAGWGGLVKVASHWFPASQYGAVMAVLSLSFLFGDAIGRFLLGRLIAEGLGWRAVFVASAAALGMIGGFLVPTLRSSPRAVGLEEPSVNPTNVFGSAGSVTTPTSLGELLGPYVTSLSFWLVCTISFGLTLIREAFNTWTAVYLVDAQGLSVADAAAYSSIFPFVGGFSTLAAGWMSDRFGNGSRMALVIPCLVFCTLALAALALVGNAPHTFLALAAIANVALWLLGPYSLLAGAIALDFGGRQGSATAAGLIDTAGYIGAAFSGYSVGQIVDNAGWSAAFRTLAIVAGLTIVAATALSVRERLVRFKSLGWREGAA